MLNTILNHPEVLTQLHETGELETRLPELARLFGVPQNAEHHPEVCTGRHTQMCLEMAARLKASPRVRFAVMTHDLGKGLTPPSEWPRHIDHEIRGLEPVRHLCDRLQVPEDHRKLALLVCQWHLHAHQAFIMTSRSVLRFLDESGLAGDCSFLLEDFLLACESDKRGRLGREEHPYFQAPFLKAVAKGLENAGPDPAAGNRDCAQWQKWHHQRLSIVRAAREIHQKK